MRVIFFLLLLFSACTQLKLRKIDESQISPSAKIIFDEAREMIRVSSYRAAVSHLASLEDESLSVIEKALKYNLKGVALFNMGDIEKSILNFEVSQKYAPKDTHLYGQVQLNIASGRYRLGQFNELKESLSKINKQHLSAEELQKYAKLSFIYSKKVQDHLVIVSSAILLSTHAKTFDEITSSNIYDDLKQSFFQLSQSQKIMLLEDFNGSANLGIAAVARMEAEERYITGDKEGARDVLQWLRSEFSENPEVVSFAEEFEFRIENSSRIDVHNIGLVLPLSGEKASFGKKALSGVDTGLQSFGINEKIKIHVKDSANSPAQGSQAVLELIRQKRVAFIIGGLFPQTAKAEYLEARKYGVLFISLSQINLPTEDKNHNLIEVQGSIESQVEALLSDNMIKKFGSKLGVIFPDNESGKAYMDEIWRKSVQKNIQITSVAQFPKNTHDYRETAKLFLGLKFPRERSEEYDLLQEVYSLEKSSIRRVQTLPPVIDFDWIFMATFPQEATQLIPTLGYYDAHNLNIVGGPSWVSKSMIKEQKNIGTLYFVGDDPKDINHTMLSKFQEVYDRPASIIEVFAMDAIKIGSEALKSAKDISSRDGFDAKLRSAGHLDGLSTSWSFKDGIWIKKMSNLALVDGEIVKIFN